MLYNVGASVLCHRVKLSSGRCAQPTKTRHTQHAKRKRNLVVHKVTSKVTTGTTEDSLFEHKAIGIKSCTR